MLRWVAIGLFALPIAGVTQAATKSRAQPKSSVEGSSKVPLQEFDFRGVRLGITAEAFRELAVPDREAKSSPAKVICSGDPETKETGPFGMKTTIATELELEKEDQDGGVIKCSYFEKYVDDWYMASVQAGSLQYRTGDIMFRFAPSTEGGALVLYEISIVMSEDAAQEVMEGLTQKWGQPFRTKKDTVQTKAGATFPHLVADWTRANSVIVLDAPSGQMDRLGLIYSLGPVAQIVRERRDRAESSAASRL